MYLMYVDESGDTGVENSPTKYYILTALVFHELRWNQYLENLIVFRRKLRDTKGLKLREEIHAVSFINKPGELIRIKRNDRIDILKQCIDWTNNNRDMNVFSVCVKKSNYHTSSEVFEKAWLVLIQRFENTIRNSNFHGPKNPDEKGLILSDNTNSRAVTKLLRKMRRFNPIPNVREYGDGNRDITIDYIIEDPVFRDSRDSYFHQIVDVIAYCARQKLEPNKTMKKKSGHNFYSRLNNVIVSEVTRSNNEGIVYI